MPRAVYHALVSLLQHPRLGAFCTCAMLLVCGTLGCAKSAAPEPQRPAPPGATAAVAVPEPIPDTSADAGAPEQSAVAVPEIDYARWQGIQALCHPDERWDSKKGCVATAAAAKLRCGLERDKREATSCRPDDLICMMRSAKRVNRRRIPAWGDPATVPELADCEKQCSADHAPSCLRLGMAYLRGVGVKQEPERGIGLVETSCLAGFGEACVSLFHLYDWVPASRSHSLAARLVEAECMEKARGHLSCAQAAQAYANGWGVVQDLRRARELRRIACTRATSACSERAYVKKLPDAERSDAISKCAEQARVCDPQR